jgi:hypothetical protein
LRGLSAVLVKHLKCGFVGMKDRVLQQLDIVSASDKMKKNAN